MVLTPKAGGCILDPEKRTNLYYLNDLYGQVARYVSEKISDQLSAEIPITSGIWGGTYLIAQKNGVAKRRIWRYYCIVNLPQSTPLDNHANLEMLIDLYHRAFIDALSPFGMDLELKAWGGTLPFSNKAKPSITMHMIDNNDHIRWLRAFFIWNRASWEESIIHDLVRIVQEYKQYFNLEREPMYKDPKELKYMLQDIVIIYRTLEPACDEDFREHAEPIITELTENFMLGLHDPKKIGELYENVFENALLYGYQETLARPYQEEGGLDITRIEEWPVDKINWVPSFLREKLVPPIRDIFQGFRDNL